MFFACFVFRCAVRYILSKLVDEKRDKNDKSGCNLVESFFKFGIFDWFYNISQSVVKEETLPDIEGSHCG